MNDIETNVTSIFNPVESANLLRVKMANRRKITAEIAAELYKAKQFYSSQGFRSDLVQSRTKFATFEGYLHEAGLIKSTVYGWLERYIPEENKLLTYEEFTEKKTIEAQERAAKNREQMNADERYRSMVAEFKKTGIAPLGWSRDIEDRMNRSDESYREFQEERKRDRKDREEAERLQRVKEAKEKQEAATRPYVSPATPTDPSGDDPKRDYYYNLGKISDEMLKNASTARATHTNKRNQWKEKIRLSAGGKEDAFLDAIIDYMETLENDNRRIEACNNIIKICRNISVELQRV